eukprot:jgi/Chlat1/2896/Chrsp2S04632
MLLDLSHNSIKRITPGEVPQSVRFLMVAGNPSAREMKQEDKDRLVVGLRVLRQLDEETIAHAMRKQARQRLRASNEANIVGQTDSDDGSDSEGGSEDSDSVSGSEGGSPHPNESARSRTVQRSTSLSKSVESIFEASEEDVAEARYQLAKARDDMITNIKIRSQEREQMQSRIQLNTTSNLRRSCPAAITKFAPAMTMMMPPHNRDLACGPTRLEPLRLSTGSLSLSKPAVG